MLYIPKMIITLILDADSKWIMLEFNGKGES